MNIPNKIEICPIIDAVIEIRFDTSLYKDVVLGLVWDELESIYNSDITPITNLQYNNKYIPLWKIECDNFVIQIGHNVLTIGAKRPYVGWNNFSKHVFLVLTKIIETNRIISNVTRLGCRYINLFKQEDFNQILINQFKYNITVNDLQEENILNKIVRLEVNKNNCLNTIQIVQDLKNNDTIIDVDTARIYKDNTFINNLRREIEEVHDCEKNIFYSLLKEDFINDLKPIYNGINEFNK